MKVICLEIVEDSVQVYYAIWCGGSKVSYLEPVTSKYRLSVPLQGSNPYCPSWSFEKSQDDCETVVLLNNTLKDCDITVNGKTHRVGFMTTLSVPLKISLSNSFREYCRSCGLLTLEDFENEFCRLSRVSAMARSDAFGHIGG